MSKARSDADRRIRQCERLARLLRLLYLIQGKGRWDIIALAEELNCSRRTIYRMLQTLSFAGVPWYLDEKTKSYRIRPGYRFPLIEPAQESNKKAALAPVTSQLIEQSETLAELLKQFSKSLREFQNPRESRGP